MKHDKIFLNNEIYTMSNLKKIVNENNKLIGPYIYLTKGVDDNKDAWYYVLVTKSSELFEHCLKNSIIHLENHGKVLESGYGNEPGKLISEKIKNNYGIT